MNKLIKSRSFCSKILYDLNIRLTNNKNMIIQPLDRTHVEELTECLNYKNLWTYNPSFIYENKQTVIDYLNKSLQHRESKKRYPFVISTLVNDTYSIAGTTSFYNYSNEHSSIAIGYTIISPSFQGKGINQEAKKLLINWCFKEFNIERIEFFVDALNEKSVKSLVKFGAVKEGILRSNLKLASNRRRDTVVLSILKNEYLLN